MKTILVEIRDRATFIPALAVVVAYEGEPGDYLLRRCGYSESELSPAIILTKLQTGESKNDIYDWNNRTMQVAHNHIEKNWQNLNDGDVVDVEFILGLSSEPKQSERITVGIEF